MSDSPSPNHGSKPDLDTLIREAELRIVAADREWQRHGDQLMVSLRGHAGTAKKASVWGGLGLAVVAVGTGLLRWRTKSRARAEARTVVGRAKGLAHGLAKGVADKWAGLSTPAQAPVVLPRRPTSSVWEVLVTTVGLLIGSAVRTGLKTTPTGRPGVGPMLFNLGLPILSRWLRGQAGRADQATPARRTPPPR